MTYEELLIKFPVGIKVKVSNCTDWPGNAPTETIVTGVDKFGNVYLPLPNLNKDAVTIPCVLVETVYLGYQMRWYVHPDCLEVINEKKYPPVKFKADKKRISQFKSQCKEYFKNQPDNGWIDSRDMTREQIDLFLCYHAGREVVVGKWFLYDGKEHEEYSTKLKDYAHYSYDAHNKPIYVFDLDNGCFANLIKFV